MGLTTAHFAGTGVRSGPLTMGQANMVRCVRTDPPEHMNYQVIRPLPQGVTVASLAEAVGVLLSRHESLRTLFTDTTQEVLAEGTLSVEVCEEAAAEVARRLQGGRFEVESEIPLRVAVITAGGVPEQVVLVTTHSAVDAIGLAVLLAEWDQLVLGKPLPPVTAPQPVDVAGTEASPASRRRAEAALRYWETQLRRIPHSTLTVSVDDTGTDWLLPRLRVRSAAAARALRRITVRTGVSGSAAVLGALATLAGLRGGADTVPVLSISANRFRPELREYVGPLAQDALVPVELDHESFDGVLGGVRSGTLAAYQNSRFDAAALIEIMERVQRERGVFFARDVVFNDMSAPGQGARVVAASDRDVRSAWLPEATLPTRTSLWVNRLEGEYDAVLWADPRCLPREDALLLGEGVARLLIEAGRRDVPLAELPELTGISPVPRGAGWVRSDQNWTELAEVRRLLPEPSEVVVEGARLVAYTAADTTPEELHETCLRQLPGRMSAVTPQHYVICARPPGLGESWPELPRLREGSGR
ncbi:condensation domain-containing protein [Acrocarpospora catenulata]|uniref:condensation domain-containing protein n=1 Tax=Acrocarpospora catenulata TaxID=2836182 RepID=UPI001BD940FD|nr:condensation domain-containing protein [Acrocarpospora catenulata]